MKPEILSLDQLVRFVIATDAELIDDCTDYYSLLAVQMHELAGIKREEILKRMLETSDDQQRKILIQFQQRNLVTLSDELVEEYPEWVQASFLFANEETSKLNLSRELYICLQELLAYMSRNFPGYTSRDIEIPLVMKIIAAGTMEKMQEDIEARLDGTGVNQRLSELLQDIVFENIDVDYREALTFRRTSWLTDFLMEVRNVLTNRPENAQRQLHMLLCTLNLNHQHALNYCVDTIHAKISKIDSPAEKISKLTLIRKRINQFTYKDDHAYNISLPSMKELLNNWISEEINYHEKQIALGLSKIEASVTEPPESFRIQFDLNVQELASMMNIAETVGVVKTRNKSDFVRAASQMFATVNQESIEPESLRTLYYKVSIPALETLMDRFVDMMNETKKRLSQAKK